MLRVMQRKPGPCTKAALQLATLVVLTVLPLTAACDSTGGSAQFLGRDTRGSITIGVKSDQPGTGWQTDGYKYSGFDIKVADALTKDLHLGKTFSNVPSEDRVAALTQSDANHVDLVIATFSITRERTKRIWFAGPYAETQQGFLVRRNGPAVYGVGMAKKDQNGRSNLQDCRRLRDALKRYVGTSAWDLDLKTELPLVEKVPDWKTRYRPSLANIDRLSCTDDVEG